MRATNLPIAVLALALAGVLAGCVDGPPYVYAERITGRTFAPLGAAVGVHPDQTVLLDPDKPFAGEPIGADTRWDVEGSSDPVAAFYCWATLLATQPNGEHQYYAALNLQRIFDQGAADEADRPAVRAMAIAAYQSVLDHFPESVTFSADGVVAFGLATPAYQGIVALGGAPRGGWTLVTTADGGLVAVKTSDPPSPLDEEAN